jgi:hypothetical protein
MIAPAIKESLNCDLFEPRFYRSHRMCGRTVYAAHTNRGGSAPTGRATLIRAYFRSGIGNKIKDPNAVGFVSERGHVLGTALMTMIAYAFLQDRS